LSFKDDEKRNSKSGKRKFKRRRVENTVCERRRAIGLKEKRIRTKFNGRNVLKSENSNINLVKKSDNANNTIRRRDFSVKDDFRVLISKRLKMERVKLSAISERSIIDENEIRKLSPKKMRSSRAQSETGFALRPTFVDFRPIRCNIDEFISINSNQRNEIKEGFLRIRSIFSKQSIFFVIKIRPNIKPELMRM
jgi:hypothetical protein